jgi:hypothetical protein
MFKKIINYFDKLEDRTRSRLSRSPVVYAMVGAFGIALFWYSITELAAAVPFMNQWHALPWFIFSLLLLLVSGVFVSYFVGDQIIMSGIRGEKKMIEKSGEEIVKEEKDIAQVLDKLEDLEQKIDELAKPEEK